MSSVTHILGKAVDMGASDVHLFCGLKPRVRIDGSLEWLDEYPEVDDSLIESIMGEVLTEKQKRQFEDELELDTGFSVPGLGRFRGNFLQEAKGPGCVFRLVPTEIPTLEEIAMPAVISEMCQHHQGLVLVTGPTGSGKSTTLAAMVNLINRSVKHHVITIEDPIEFIHPSIMSTVTQREVGKDTKGFLVALRSALREDPDVILVGELRDHETMGMALRAAETGHLVLSTLHTTSAVGTINRFVETFPSDSHDQVRLQLAQALRGVVSQRLLPRADERGRIACVEIMVMNPAVSALIREGKTHQIQSQIQTGRKAGMQLFDQELLDLLNDAIITHDVAMANAFDKNSFADAVKKYHKSSKGRRIRAKRPTWRGGRVEEIRASSKRRGVQDRLQQSARRDERSAYAPPRRSVRDQRDPRASAPPPSPPRKSEPAASKEGEGFLGESARSGSWLFSDEDGDGLSFGDEPSSVSEKGPDSGSGPARQNTPSSKRRRSQPPPPSGGGISFRKPQLGGGGRSQPRRKE